jgi:cell division protein FtsL
MSIYGYVAVGIVLLLFALFIVGMIAAASQADQERERIAERQKLWQAREQTEAEAARFRALVEIRNSVNRRVQ